jgi:hypothetical protein
VWAADFAVLDESVLEAPAIGASVATDENGQVFLALVEHNELAPLTATPVQPHVEALSITSTGTLARTLWLAQPAVTPVY